MSSVPPARSTRVGAFDSMRKRSPRSWEANDLATKRIQVQARVADQKRRSECLRRTEPRQKLRGGGLFSGGTRNARTGDEVRPFLLFLGESGIRLEAAPAARFVHAGGANDDELFAFHKPLRVNRGIAAANADREQLGDFLGDGQQTGHRLERAAAVVGIQPGNNNRSEERRVGKEGRSRWSRGN